MGDEVLIRRARRGDLDGIAAVVGAASGGEVEADGVEVMDWLFSKGMWVAVQDEAVVGVATCQTENLVSVTDGFHVSPKLRDEAGGPLLAAVEAEVSTLMCEVNIVVLPESTAQEVRDFLAAQGYEPEEFKALHRIYREVLGDLFGTDEATGPVLMVKRLRDRMVMVPI